jgi:o-succinylbenzoate synthase
VPITEVRTHHLSAELHTPFVTALRRTTHTRSLIVELIDEDGRRGLGEAPQVWQVTGDSIAGAQSCVDEVLAPLLIGRDPDEPVVASRAAEGAVRDNHAAKMAIDIALHDLSARRQNLSLVRHLGGSATSVETDVTLSAGPVDGLRDAATARVKDGFTTLKLKVGTDAAGDLARIAAVREAAGPSVTIRLDANQGWTPRDAVRVIHGLEDAGLGIEFVEQPVAHWDLDGLAWVSERVETPIMADEAVFGVRDLVEVIRRRAADLVNVKLAKCGGLTHARTLLELARAHGMGTIIGSMMESPIGIGAAAALAAAYPTTAVSDLDAAWWLAASPVQGGVRYEGSRIVLPDAAGLGIEL